MRSPVEQTIGRDVRRVLLAEWDPVGVRDIGGPDDEYDSYIWPMVGLLRSGANRDAVADHLLKIETEKMGLPGDPPNALRVAERLLALVDR